MDKLILKTSLKFPAFKLTELVSYSVVRKPSGVAYILLVLIRDSKQRTMRMADALVNFGVPERLHHIFKDAMDDLIRQGLMTSYFGSSISESTFSKSQIHDYTFTAKGEKIFADGYIPATDEDGKPIEKETKINIFYDIATNSFFLKFPEDLEGRPLKDAPITPEFFEQFSIAKSEEDFINASKGPAIGIKKEEIVTKVETQAKENYTVKYDFNIEIEGDTARIVFGDKALQSFFAKYYKPEIVNQALLQKEKFRFSYPNVPTRKLSEFPDASIKRVLIPKDLGEVVKQKIRLMVTAGDYGGEGLVLKASGPLPFGAEFLRVNARGEATAYVLGNFEFDVWGFDTIRVPLALELSLEQSQLQQVLKPIVNGLAPFSSENYEKLVRVTECSKDYDEAFKIMEGYLANLDFARQIGLLSEMRPYSLLSPRIFEKEKELVARAYEGYVSTIDESTVEAFLKVTAWIPKYLGRSAKDVLDRVFDQLQSIEDPVGLYQVLLEAPFDEALACSYVNPVPECLRTKQATHPLLVSLINFVNSLERLKKECGIADYRDFRIDFESIDRGSVRTTYATASAEKKRLKPFETENKDLFREFDAYLDVFGRINDDINMMENALKNPRNIKPEVIEKKINAGEFQYVLVNLSGKLEAILQSEFGLSGTLSDMLSEARRQKMIDKAIVSDLHDFREARNANVHQGAPSARFAPDDLRRWSAEIFELAKKEEKDQ
ncbi:MAG: hypothetical protein PUJ43_04890 [Bacillales bacterium]|nr:hypothetical protein [Bacillales bacterium]MDY5920575.1 hypothetical protein [Candidatus Enteromonas sp.]